MPQPPNSFADILDFLDNIKKWLPATVRLDSAEQTELADSLSEEIVGRIRAYIEWRREMPLPGDAAYRAEELSPVNAWSLNVVAKRWLIVATEHPDPHLPYLIQLLNLGFARQLPIPGWGDDRYWEIEQEAGQLLDRNLDPIRLTHWFVNNPDGGDESEQKDTLLSCLEEAKDWEEAALKLME